MLAPTPVRAPHPVASPEPVDVARPDQRRRAGHRPRSVGVAATLAAPAGTTAAVALALHLDVPAAVHEIALFVHLAALVVGFGAVLAVDWLGVLWLARRTRLADVLTTASRLTVPIWLGLAGLIATGALLSPDPTSPRTLLKLVLVALAGANGAYVHRLHPRLAAAGEAPSPGLLRRGATSTAVSQLCWWGATVIGFLNARS